MKVTCSLTFDEGVRTHYLEANLIYKPWAEPQAQVFICVDGWTTIIWGLLVELARPNYPQIGLLGYKQAGPIKQTPLVTAWGSLGLVGLLMDRILIQQQLFYLSDNLSIIK